MSSESKQIDQTKRKRRKDDRPDEILAASMDEFAEFGFERARLTRIAKKAGIAKGTIYLYFDSKEALFEAAISRYMVSAMEETRADFQRLDGSPTEQLRVLISGTYERVVGSPAEIIMRILVSEGPRLPWMAERYYELAISKFIVLLQEVIGRGVASGDFQESPMTRVPHLLIAPAMFLTINRMVFSTQNHIDQADFFEGHLHMVMRALKA